MERLTFDGEFCDISMCREELGGPFCEEGYCSQRRVWERLKSIEDILGDDYDLDRIQELAQADREGRCVVLPCKVGDTVYRVVTPTPGPPLLSEMKITTMKQAASLVNLVGKHKLVSYYLTREEAEAALREEEK